MTHHSASQPLYVSASAPLIRRWRDVLSFVVIGTPVGKARARIVYGKGAYTPEKTRAAEEEIGWLAKEAWAGKPLQDGPVSLTVYFFFPIPRSWPREKRVLALNCELLPTVKPDLDNCTKLVSDALTGIVWKNDSQAIFIRVAKFYSDRPRTEIVVGSLEEVKP